MRNIFEPPKRPRSEFARVYAQRGGERSPERHRSAFSRHVRALVRKWLSSQRMHGRCDARSSVRNAPGLDQHDLDPRLRRRARHRLPGRSRSHPDSLLEQGMRHAPLEAL